VSKECLLARYVRSCVRIACVSVEGVTGCDVCVVEVPIKHLIFDGSRLISVVLTACFETRNRVSGFS
jgi:hypothetical protein